MSELSERLLQQILEEQIAQNGKLAAVEQTVKDTSTRLFGNGQPGLLQKHEDRMKNLETDIAVMKGKVGAISSFVAAAVAALAFIVKAIFAHYFK